MNRREFLHGSAQTLAATGIAGRLPVSALAPAQRPNVIWLIADQWRAQALGVNGDPNAHTPVLDRMARSGMNFTQARSGFPLCCPFRGTMLTSRYPNHMVPGHEYPLPAGQKTIANIFNDSGYDTAYFGKWHLDGFHEKDGRAALHIVPPDRRGGFETWIGYENNNSPWDTWVHGGAGKDAFQYRLPGYETDALTDLLLKYIRGREKPVDTSAQKPFFAILSVEPTHDPYIAPPQYMEHYNAEHMQLRPNVPLTAIIPQRVRGQIAPLTVAERARQELAGYYAQQECWDTNIGRVIDQLDQLHMLDNTHVVIFADHGDMHGSHGQFLKTNPLEESVRIPMIFTGAEPFYDGHLTGTSELLFAAADLAPTTLGLCGIDAPQWMEGHDYSGYRVAKRPKAPEPDSQYLQNVIPTGHGDSIDEPYRGLVTKEGWKYVCFANQSWLMYNLADDPYEQVNVAFNSIYRQERKALIDRLSQWIHDTGDHFDVPTFV
jgi:arylsulfatase A-like enzyme